MARPTRRSAPKRWRERGVGKPHALAQPIVARERGPNKKWWIVLPAAMARGILVPRQRESLRMGVTHLRDGAVLRNPIPLPQRSWGKGPTPVCQLCERRNGEFAAGLIYVVELLLLVLVPHQRHRANATVGRREG